MEPTAQTEPTNVQPKRNFVIPDCEVVIQCQQEAGISVEQLLAIVFNLAASNPGAKVDFAIKVLGGE